MTNDREGLTFIDYSWKVTHNSRTNSFHMSPEEMRRRHYHYMGEGEVVEEIQTPHVVPNGMWVLERPSFGWAWLTGVEFKELELFEYHDKDGIYHRLYSCDKPFGYIVADGDDVDHSVNPKVVKSSGRKTLVYARQVHKGELGQGVRTPTLDYVRQPLAPHRGLAMKARERRRGQYGWVQMCDLGMAASMPFRRLDWIELVLGYWQFSGHVSWKNGQQVLVDTMRGSAHEIELGNTTVVSMTLEQFRAEAEEDSDELWIRRGFAYTILRLQALGVKPEVTHPV